MGKRPVSRSISTEFLKANDFRANFEATVTS